MWKATIGTNTDCATIAVHFVRTCRLPGTGKEVSGASAGASIFATTDQDSGEGMAGFTSGFTFARRMGESYNPPKFLKGRSAEIVFRTDWPERPRILSALTSFFTSVLPPVCQPFPR
jgi:hypothetical protein